MATIVEPGALQLLKTAGSVDQAVALRIIDLQEANGKLKCNFSDGKENMPGVITSQVSRQFGASLKSNDIVRVTEGNVNSINEKQVLIVAGMEVIEHLGEDAAAGAGAGDVTTESTANKPTDTAENATKKPKIAAAHTEPTPAPHAVKIDADVAMPDAAPGAEETKTPAAGIKTSAAMPRTGPTPPTGDGKKEFDGVAGLPTASKDRNAVPISSLNPYLHGWTIRAKVLAKGTKRSFSGKNGAASSVFSVELVDDQGTSIDGTFWREAADKYHDLLQEGQVYVFSRGSVKPANKKFSQTRNDYCLNFDNNSQIEIAEIDNVTAAAMTAKLEFVPIDQLAAFVDKKATVDIMGIVTAVAPLGSIKRKTDSTEISRRDITLVDQGLKTVTLTLWGGAAENAGAELEALATTSPVVAISACRVSSYNGVSVSALSRSQVLIQPVDAYVEKTQALQAWWQSEGCHAQLTPVGEGLPSAMKNGVNGGGPKPRVELETVRAEAPEKPEDKAVYSTVAAAVASISPDQSMWYLACPENNRKVVEQNGQYFCEWDGKTYGSATHRYILMARFADESGELPVQIFNDQAELLLGRTADDLAGIKESDPARFTAMLSDAAWTEWVFRLKAQAQEYNGEVRKRFAVADIKPMDYAVETKRALERIAQSA